MIHNSQDADQNAFNNAFMSRTDDTSTAGKVDLQNTKPESGTSVLNLQRYLNAVSSFLGVAVDALKDALPSWATSHLGTATDNIKQRIEAHDAAFSGDGGHAHDGTNGGGAKVSAANVVSAPSGNLAAVSVQGALDELQADVDTRATASALSGHTGATNNPHTVTAAQVGNATAQWNADKIQGVEVNDAAKADGFSLVYDATTSKLKYAQTGAKKFKSTVAWGESDTLVMVDVSSVFDAPGDAIWDLKDLQGERVLCKIVADNVTKQVKIYADPPLDAMNYTLLGLG